jgi:hypothetical protein
MPPTGNQYQTNIEHRHRQAELRQGTDRGVDPGSRPQRRDEGERHGDNQRHGCRHRRQHQRDRQPTAHQARYGDAQGDRIPQLQRDGVQQELVELHAHRSVQPQFVVHLGDGRITRSVTQQHQRRVAGQ